MSDKGKKDKEKKPQDEDSGVVFFGWQETFSGEPKALYNITAEDHPSCGSTVTEKTLNKLNLQVPKQKSSKGNGDISEDSQDKEKNYFV